MYKSLSVGLRPRPEHQVVNEKKTSGTQVKSIAAKHQVKCNIKIAVINWHRKHYQKKARVDKTWEDAEWIAIEVLMNCSYILQ